jgi:RNA:NAD 2'-phosphotransferase (TPT1/KptA family)
MILVFHQTLRIHQIFLEFFYDFYDYSPRAFPGFSTPNPSQPHEEQKIPECVMHQILPQFVHKIAVESLFPHEGKRRRGKEL